MPPPFLQPVQEKIQNGFFRKLWHWFIEPSPKITQPDQRRQAAFLTTAILGSLVLTIGNKTFFGSLNGWTTNPDYPQTFITLFFLSIIYFVSRTQYLQLALILALGIGSIDIFVIGLGDPRIVLRGLFDYLILPLWIGIFFLDFKKIIFLSIAMLLALLVFPFLSTGVTLNDILIGPFAFLFTTSNVLVFITHYRNKLEQEHQVELSAKEQNSRREAARAEALLRIAGRLNAQLDLDMVLAAISDEVSRALNTPVSIVTLFDRKQNHFYAAVGTGLSPDFIKDVPYISITDYEEMINGLGKVSVVPDIQQVPSHPYLTYLINANLHSIAFAAMEYEHELIGVLNVITFNAPRDFTKDELLLLRGLADQAALAIVNTRLYKTSRRRLERLQALRTIDVAIVTNRDLRETLKVLLEKITEQLKVDAAVFLLLDESSQQLEFANGLGFHTPTLSFTRLRMGEGIAGRAAQQMRMIHIPDLRSDPQTLAYAPALNQESFVSYFATPLIAQGCVKGVLEIFHRSQLNPNEEWLSFLEALAGQAAIAIESTTLFEDLQNANKDLFDAYDTTIEGWSHALDLRDKETEGHTQRVTELTLKFAKRMGLKGDELVHVRRGALLHDIGKMGVPDDVLLKPGKLTEEEWAIMRKHPVYAYELLSPITYLRPAIDIPYCHHEKWDGTGYPRGLSGEQIPFAARLFALVDVWDALLSDRPYRKSWSKEKVTEYIRSLAGTHFDPKVAFEFLRMMDGQEPQR